MSHIHAGPSLSTPQFWSLLLSLTIIIIYYHSIHTSYVFLSPWPSLLKASDLATEIFVVFFPDFPKTPKIYSAAVLGPEPILSKHRTKKYKPRKHSASPLVEMCLLCRRQENLHICKSWVCATWKSPPQLLPASVRRVQQGFSRDCNQLSLYSRRSKENLLTCIVRHWS